MHTWFLHTLLTVLLGPKSLEEPLPFRNSMCQAWSVGPRGLGPWQLFRLCGGADRGRRKMGVLEAKARGILGGLLLRAVISRIMLL